MVLGRRKGVRGELEVAGIVRQWWNRLEPAALFVRTPLSGGWQRSTGVASHYKACGDLMTTAAYWPFCVEVKWREGWGVDNLLDGKVCPPWEWWDQTLRAAREQSSVPMMWLRRNRVPRSREPFPWLVWVPADFVARQALSEPDIVWSTVQLKRGGAHHGGVMPVVYDYRRFVEMSPQRMRDGRAA